MVIGFLRPSLLSRERERESEREREPKCASGDINAHWRERRASDAESLLHRERLGSFLALDTSCFEINSSKSRPPMSNTETELTGNMGHSNQPNKRYTLVLITKVSNKFITVVLDFGKILRQVQSRDRKKF